jgi:hypothetical protein
MWMYKTMSITGGMPFASRRMCGSMLAAWRHTLPVAIEHGVRDMPYVMMLLFCTFVLSKGSYACQGWGLDMLQLSPCGQSSLQSELLSICKHVLRFHGSIAQAPLLSMLGLQPVQIIWLNACVKFFAIACHASRHSHRERLKTQPPRSRFASGSASGWFEGQAMVLQRSTAAAGGSCLDKLELACKCSAQANDPVSSL